VLWLSGKTAEGELLKYGSCLMNESEVIDYMMKTFPDVETTTAYGYHMFFYRSDRKLSFATLIAADYEYDQFSNLNRPGIFRLNIGVSKQTFQSIFGTEEVDLKDYDFTALDVIMPHPEYAQYHFICVLSPSEKSFEEIRPLLAEAHDIAARRYASQNKNKEAGTD
jgi:hypothetical protein